MIDEIEHLTDNNLKAEIARTQKALEYMSNKTNCELLDDYLEDLVLEKLVRLRRAAPVAQPQVRSSLWGALADMKSAMGRMQSA